MTAKLTVCLLLAAALPPAAGATGASVWNDFAAVDLSGRQWTAEQLAGRVVLLDFWATWCAPCLAEIPTLRQASDRFGERGFLVLGVSMNRTDRRTLSEFLRRQEIEWPQLHDGRGFAGSIARRFQVEAVPRALLIDRSGRLVGVDLTSDVLLAALPALLEGGRTVDSAVGTTVTP